MSAYKVAVIVGSLRRESYNLKLAKALIKLGEGKFKAEILRIHDLPLYNQDLESNFPEAASRMKAGLDSADGILIVTPEFNRSIPAPLKNAIEWASRPYGKNSFSGKPVATSGISAGAIGTACAQQNLRWVLVYLNTHVMGQPEVYLQFKDGLIDNNNNVTNEGTQKFLRGYIDKFVEWIESHQKR
jgi:chromate reductase